MYLHLRLSTRDKEAYNMDSLPIISLIVSALLTFYMVWSEARSSRQKTQAERLGFSDELAKGAQTLIEITRNELERERKKRLALEKEVDRLREDLSLLKIELNHSINTAMLLYGQLVSAGLKPVSEVKKIGEEKNEDC
jgi:hypothetical protein